MNKNSRLNLPHKALWFIIDFQRRQGYSPSLAEIKDGVGLRSVRGVSLQLDKLEQGGYISRQKHARRAITVLAESENSLETVSLPLVGSVQAGTPTLAEQNIESYKPVPASWLRGREGAYLLRVSGNSMSRAGYLEGDLVVVVPKPVPDNRDVVVARRGDEATLKRFERRGDHAVLWPESDDPQYKPLIAKEIAIDGVVVGKLSRS